MGLLHLTILQKHGRLRSQLKQKGKEMRMFLVVLAPAALLFSAMAASAQGWFTEGRYLIGQTETRLSYQAVSVAGTSDFRSYGVIAGYGWRLGESPFTFSAVGGIYGGGVSETGTWTNGVDSLTLDYDQPWSVTLGGRLSAEHGRWSPYIEGGLVATRHELDGSLTQGGVTTLYQESATTHGLYGEIGVGYAFSDHGRLNVAVHARRAGSGAVEQTTLAASLGLRWQF